MAKAAALYQRLTSARQEALDRARKASELAAPGMIPQEGADEHSDLSQPYQSVAAHGVASLSSRTLLTLFPPNVPFFRYRIDQKVAEDLGADQSAANVALAKRSISLYTMMQDSGLRPVLASAIAHLVVGGSVLLNVPDKGKPRMYRLDQFVIKRDYFGRPVDVVIKESIDPSVLPPEFVAGLGVKPEDNQKLDLFTVIQWRGDVCEHWQEIKDKVLPGSRGRTPADASAWICPRWSVVPGSDYGVGHVTKYIGDILSLEDLSKAMVQFAQVASRIITLVHPNSTTDIDELAKAESGDFIHGDKDSVSTLGLDKGQDWGVMNQLAERIESRVGNAFLSKSAAVRDAERVTAEEVRMIAEELETVLGGTYTALAAELQPQLVARYESLAVKAKRLEKLPDTITPSVVTGFDALGRAAEVNRLRAFVSDFVSLVGPEKAYARLNDGELAQRLGEGSGIEGLDRLLKSDEEMSQAQSQAMMSQAALNAAPAIATAAGKAATEQNPG